MVDKPRGPTSTAVVNKVRWAFEAQKAGHAGTLDPEASGLLVIALGEATKAVAHVTDALKAYQFRVAFGSATTTDDVEGDVCARSDARPDDADIIAALPQFVGNIQQIPPKFSAVKIDGARAYDLARDGADFEVAARPLYVDSLSMIDRPDPDHAVLELVCGKGGYVRSIARDLGEALGCFGHVHSLRRIWSGPFDLEDGAVPFDVIEAEARTPEIDQHLLPLAQGLADLPEARLTPEGVARIGNGNPGQVAFTEASYGDLVWASDMGTPRALGIYRAGEVHPSRVFNL